MNPLSHEHTVITFHDQLKQDIEYLNASKEDSSVKVKTKQKGDTFCAHYPRVTRQSKFAPYTTKTYVVNIKNYLQYMFHVIIAKNK